MGTSFIRSCNLMVVIFALSSAPNNLIAKPVHINVIAAQFSPLQMVVDGKARGYVTELVEEVIKRVNQNFPINASKTKIMPFRCALKILGSKPNVLFFSLSRTKQRENEYIWVGETSPYEIYFYKVKDNKQVMAKTIDDALKFKHRLGVAAGSNTEGFLHELGFQKGHQFVTYSHYSKGIAMLFKRRFDMMPLTSFVARLNVCKLGFDGDALVPMIRVDALSKPLWLVFSKGTDPALVEHFNRSLAALKLKGVDKLIRERYLNELNGQPCNKQN